MGEPYIKIWIDNHGPIPKDWEGRTYEIHHIDGNEENHDITNLRCVSIREHYDIHWFQNDYGAAFALAIRMKISPIELSTLASLRQQKRVEDGTHNFLGPEYNRHRVENGTHPFLGGAIQKQRIENGTHHFLDKEAARKRANNRVNEGTHNFLNPQPIECPHCGKIGRGGGMLTWHFDNCRYKGENI